MYKVITKPNFINLYHAMMQSLDTEQDAIDEALLKIHEDFEKASDGHEFLQDDGEYFVFICEC